MRSSIFLGGDGGYSVLVRSEVSKCSMRSSNFSRGGGGLLCSPTQNPVLWDFDNELAGNHLIEHEKYSLDLTP